MPALKISFTPVRVPVPSFLQMTPAMIQGQGTWNGINASVRSVPALSTTARGENSPEYRPDKLDHPQSSRELEARGGPDHQQHNQGMGGYRSSHSDHPAQQSSPSHVPKGGQDNEQMYILTILTDSAMHNTMTNLRKQYFPPRLNHLDAHITLFHALPESKLESDVRPAIRKITDRTKRFKMLATTPFKLKKGMAIGMPKDHGGNAAKDIHAHLVREWSEFLSRQDFGFQAHFTIMNKVDDGEAVAKAFSDVKHNFKAVVGTANGLSLYRYTPSAWHWMEDFQFQD